MIHEIENIIKELGTKPTWSGKELIPKLQSASSKLSEKLEAEGKIVTVTSSKKTKVTVIKKYDILYLPLLGMPHYLIVHKVKGEIVYGVSLTSTERFPFTIHKIEKDRVFEASSSFATTSYFSVSMEEAKNCFIRTYENRKEADQIFKAVTAYYKSIFK